MKQTRDANKRRQVAPFKAEDLVYLSAKNISFPKGLARKLIPKFLGPYKVLRDYGNSSFQLELPPHLKRRGVHDVFHSSLLRIHIPNDDRLFPGRMDTQIVGEDAKDNEWAVDRIKSHSGTKTDAVFEIQWKSGDVTWLPYYQITHLQALTDYLELIGVSKVSKLPPGPGRPPSNDPQIFLGSLSLQPPPDSFLFCSPLLSPLPLLKRFTQSIISAFHLPFKKPFCSPTIDLEQLSVMPHHRGVKHPAFTRISPTHYIVKEPDNSLSSTVHVGQIADYINFDEQLRRNGGFGQLQSMPIGFPDFANLWNLNAHDKDNRRLCRVYVPEGTNEYHVQLSNVPVYVTDFYITGDQVGLANPRQDEAPNHLHNEIMQEFASIMMEERRNSRRDQRTTRLGNERRAAQRNHYPDGQPLTNSVFRPNHALSRLRFKERGRKARRHRSPTPTR